MHSLASRARGFTTLLASVLLATALLPAAASAEGKLRIAEQYGVVYLLLNVAQDQKLIEKQGKARGVDIQVEWAKLSGGSTVNDALLSGAIDVAGAGVGPLLTVWDRTRGRQNVKGVASLGSFPYYLVTNNPNVRTLADFTDKDRIALPAVTVSVQARILQLAVAKQWGDKQFNKLDHLTQALPHPDAAAAVIAGKTEITSHFGSPPFQDQELAQNRNAHVVLNSYDVLGGPSSATVLYATEKFRTENPKTYAALIDALAEAANIIRTNPERAADAYLRANKGGIDRALLLKTIKDPQNQFTIIPQNTWALAQFLYRIGAIKNQPHSWRDYFFEDPATAQGG
jgi:NitT/TauT family transport system substrate-binding protein